MFLGLRRRGYEILDIPVKQFIPLGKDEKEKLECTGMYLENFILFIFINYGVSLHALHCTPTCRLLKLTIDRSVVVLYKPIVIYYFK